MSDDNKDVKPNEGGDSGEPKAPPNDQGGGGGQEPDKKAAPDSANVSKYEAQIKKLEARADAAEKKADELESEKLKKAGDLDGLIKKERERNAKLTEQLKEVKKQTLKQDLKTQVLKIAPDIHDVDLVTSLPEMKETVQMDHESLTLSNVEEGLAKVRKARPYLFKIQGRAVGPTRLPNPNSGKLGSDAEALEFQQKLFAAKSKPEQEIVRQKYGREL